MNPNKISFGPKPLRADIQNKSYDFNTEATDANVSLLSDSLAANQNSFRLHTEFQPLTTVVTLANNNESDL